MEHTVGARHYPGAGDSKNKNPCPCGPGSPGREKDHSRKTSIIKGPRELDVWHTPVIPGSWEAEAGGFQFEANLGNLARSK